MATSEAQKKAVLKYKNKNRDRIHRVAFDIYESKDRELWLWLNSQDEGRGTILRRLIRNEIERTGWQPEARPRRSDEELIG